MMTRGGNGFGAKCPGTLKTALAVVSAENTEAEDHSKEEYLKAFLGCA